MPDMLPVHVEIDAALKQMTESGVFFYVLQRGDPHTGGILLKISDRQGTCRLITRQRDYEGMFRWSAVLEAEQVTEMAADDYIRSAVRIDPDLWVIEIEDFAFQNPFDV